MPGIKNPRPQLQCKISVLYHNVQGFLITRELHKENPLLNTKKVSDFQSYVYLHKRDIIILNETWLNKSIFGTLFSTISPHFRSKTPYILMILNAGNTLEIILS